MAEPLDDSTDDATFSLTNLSDPVVIMLLFQELIREEQVRKAWEKWRQLDEKQRRPLWRLLIEVDGIDPAVVYATAAEVYGFKTARINRSQVLRFLRDQRKRFTQEQWDWMRREWVLPIGQEVDEKRGITRWLLGTHDPTRPSLQRQIVVRLGIDHFELQYVPAKVIEKFFQEAFPRRNEYLERVQQEDGAVDLGMNYEEETELIDEESLEAEINRSKLINLFEAALVEAVHQGASDIHIFPNHNRQVEIHFRIDGELNCWHVEDKVHPEAFLAVVKDQAGGVDRFERDKAQDGFIQRWIDDHLIRFRVSVLPIATASFDVRAESIVIRVLDDRKVIKDLRLLGLSERALERFEWAIRQPYGMVIVTGPTGSGKSTTLYAALHQVVSPRKNVLTVEDPVEYIIPGVRQIKLSHKLGLEDALRAILRHDPDIVMVGEMRDRQTAELAIKLANTGHLTFST
ncbi:MAG: ATPase, T2SS/T4P/T4SS family, partial [Rhodothermus sp.]|nr:ATPase, T2SS/T4P/T4SS family [Rhodothermus sp.]